MNVSTEQTRETLAEPSAEAAQAAIAEELIAKSTGTNITV